ncbi:MAG: thioredoxin-disulfide reductase [Firmicutes bacterium]|nr:thioredoxin-disulfide reductase [Bacillota bacterium]
MEKRKVIILGTGPAGLTAAIYAARANLSPLVIEGNEPGGQLMMTTEVENFPGFPDAIMGPDLMDQMRKQAEKVGAEFIFGWANAVDFSQKPFTVTVNESDVYQSESIIISTGASARLMGIPGESEMIGHGVSTCATCDGFFFRNKSVLVIGGGDSAMEEALYLAKIAAQVTIVHRRDALRASKIMQERAQENEKIKWVMDVTSLSIKSQNNQVAGLEVQDNKTGERRVIPADGIFVAIGHQPNTAFLNQAVAMDPVGYIKTNGIDTATNVHGIFACGDVVDFRYRQAITAAGSGCRAAMDVEKYLEGTFVHDWSVDL